MKKTVKIGPFGGESGDDFWDHGGHTTIRQMFLHVGMVIDYIAVEYDQNGRSKWYGANDSYFGGSTIKDHQIKLDYPDEYLTSISGFYNVYTAGRVYFSSLMLKSNKRKFGPFGSKQDGNYFFIPSKIGKIVGLFGIYGLTSIGAYLEPTYPFKSFGPFGGNGGDSWNDGVYTTIRRITIESESVINSILIEYDNDGNLVSSSKHGGSEGGGTTNVVDLDYPDEYVTSVSGYYGANLSLGVVQSITIQTNKRVYGPFGVGKGKYFSFPPTEGKIIGFHGKCGSHQHLNSIGGHLEHTSNLYMVKSIGPFGEGNGYSWDDESHSGIKQIRIVHGAFVSSICAEYYNDDGLPDQWSDKHGEDHESNITMIKLDFPDEFLTSVAGYYDSVNKMNDNEFTSLTFQSNRRTYGPFGREFGKYFSFPSFDGKILGFHGRSSGYLYAFGAHVEPISNPPPSEFFGPFGGQGGDQWDDGIHTTIRQLIVSSGSIINSIGIEYDKNGQSIWSSKHGSSVGDKTYTIKLDYPDEFLISISGSISANSNNSTIIQSLTFESNKKIYGPFGTGTENNDFCLSSIAYGKIIGFHGSCNEYLHSIGVYLKPIPMSYQYETFKQCGGEGEELWDDGIHTTIRQLIVGAGSLVYSLQVEYDEHGRSLLCTRRGDSIEGNKYMVKLDYPGEYLISISGYYGSDGSSSYIYSLTFKSNRRTYGPFGSTRGIPFSTPSDSVGKIIGFHGTAYVYLHSIGVHVKPISPIVLGPFGAQDGDPWDDKFYSTLRQIQLTVSEFGIESIRFKYDKNGRSIWSTIHGSKAEGKLVKVIMDYPSEFLISVSGTYGEEHGSVMVQSITFQSNRETYGPFGLNKGNHFSLASTGDKIIGFHGRSGHHISAIGAYIEPVSYL